jgi:hypothetical protein
MTKVFFRKIAKKNRTVELFDGDSQRLFLKRFRQSIVFNSTQIILKLELYLLYIAERNSFV